MSTYRFCDNVWTLVLKDFVVKDSNQSQHNAGGSSQQLPRADKVKIVACDGKGLYIYFSFHFYFERLVFFFLLGTSQS